MHATLIGIICLIWLSGGLEAQSSVRRCRAPLLNNGFLVPEQDIYNHGTQLTYSCDPEHKPVLEGWWQTVTCQGGKWSHKPECIEMLTPYEPARTLRSSGGSLLVAPQWRLKSKGDRAFSVRAPGLWNSLPEEIRNSTYKSSCLPLLISNGKYLNKQLWFPNGFELSTTCDTGYTHREFRARAFCVNGTWSPVPVCRRRIDACDEPVRKPNAVVVNRRHQTVFEADSELQYECEDGYSFTAAVPKKTIVCRFGQWTLADPCVKKIPTSTGHSTSGGGIQHTGSGATSGGMKDNEDTDDMTSVSRCGRVPVIENGEAVVTTRTYIKYQCAAYYTLEGSHVYCLTSGSWSKLPTCKANFCLVNTERYTALKNAGNVFLKHGEKRRLECNYGTYWNYYAVAHCDDGELRISQCCTQLSLNVGSC